jgi:two-component system OmpR family response regulator
MRHCEEVVTRSMLIEHVRDFHFDAHTNVGETHLSRVGAKVDKLFDAP